MGWDNIIFRLETELAVRPQRRAVAAELILRELQLPLLAYHHPRQGSQQTSTRCRCFQVCINDHVH